MSDDSVVSRSDCLKGNLMMMMRFDSAVSTCNFKC